MHLLEKNHEEKNDKHLIREIQRDINTLTAALLLTGQITIKGTFVTTKSFRLSLGGPLTGTQRLEGINGNKTATILLDLIDIILAILLIKGAIVVEGIFIGSREFTLNVSGPIFGVPFPEPSLPSLIEDYHRYKKVTKRFNIHQEPIEKFKKE
ncbi:hypothetical protein BACCIP111895_01237 [Neobacillus rhizosphaerae]|uniref:Uncharacterized protein n=1 Tax=Neobacillus rhizosphaerae TaxID=2880965 RepID=A0ABN8KKY5_9BACI|nr:hypothetical protein [Neobacillus rhizosphaerae]CAH2714083.1 hypothetical protein BACCIP111895_01237 [Neobacillus rhizosphaerae]